MAINFNGTQYVSSNSAQNINWDGKSICTVCFLSDNRTGIVWDRGCFCVQSNNYANLDYRVWIPSNNHSLLCYCWRTNSQDSDSHFYWCQDNNRYNGNICANINFRLTSRGNFNNPTITVNGYTQCTSTNYTISLGFPTSGSTGWKSLVSAGSTGNYSVVICPPTCTGWMYGYLNINSTIGDCWYYHGISCNATAVRWIPYYGVVCVNTGYQSFCYCKVCCVAATTFTWCYCLGY